MNDNVTSSGLKNRRRTSIVNAAQLITISVIALFAVCLIMLILGSKYHDQAQRSQAMRTAHVELQKDITRREVERVVESIQQRRSHARGEALDIAKQRVDHAHSIAEHMFQTFRNRKTRTEIEEMILTALCPVRFDQGMGYYFVVSLDDNTILLSEKMELNSVHYSKFESAEEQAAFTKLIALSKEQDEGSFEYKWSRPGKTGSNHHKIAYVKRFTPYNLVIGTGLYMEDIEVETKQELKTEIANIKYGANGYFFINDFHGNILAHGDQPELVGASNWEYTDSRGNKLFQDLRRVVKNPEGGFSYYWWRLPETGEERPKIAFAMAVPEWEWLIGTGLYLDDVDADVAQMQTQLRNETIREVAGIVLTTIMILLVVYLLMQHLFRALRRDLTFFNECFALAAQQNVSINEKKIKFSELSTMAQNANRMLSEKAQLLHNLHDEKQQLFVMLQSITDGVIATNAKDEIILLNAVAEQMIDKTAEQAYGKTLTDTIHLFDEQAQKTFALSMKPSLKETSTTAFPDHIYLMGKSGQKYNIEIVSAPIQNQDGANQGTIVVLRDVTAKRKNEQEQLRLMKLESVGLLAGGIAHDFNNLLAALLGNIELAKACITPSDEAYLYIKDAENVMYAARGLATQLLTFSKGGAPVKKTIALRDELVAAAEFSLRGSSVELETKIADDLFLVDADRGQINQVISNLIINAKQAMPNGGKVILQAQNENDKWIIIKLTDQGTGIPVDIQDKIFDPYFTTKANGNGLGLASCHSIITNHGGTIDVESELGKGTSFIIKLPASQKTIPDVTVEHVAPADVPKIREARILVVDDMKTVRAVLARTLIHCGHAVEEASNYDEALKQYSEALKNNTRFDLVITDLTIPGSQGGEEIAKALRKMDPDARIVVASGYSDSPVMAKYQHYGFAECLAKPYTIDEVRTVVNKVLKGN